MEDYLYNAVTLISLPFSYGYMSNTLRFFAKLITHDCADVDRLFVISYFLSDDTLSVFEPIERNSGKRHTSCSNFLRPINCLFILRVREYDLIL